MEADTDSGQTVEARFITKLEDFQVTDTPFRIPSSFGRYGLSGLINHLLNLSPPKPFDFLIENEFLRSNLEDFLKKRQISLETTLTIEYVEAITAPEPENTLTHNDWISSLVNFEKYVITGSYDKLLRLCDPEGQVLFECEGHTEPIKSLTPINAAAIGAKKDSLAVASASMDHSILLWEMNPKSKTHSVKVKAVGHSASVESISSIPNTSDKFVSAGWDSHLFVWDVADASGAIPTESKRRKSSQVLQLKPKMLLEGHSQCISTVIWATLRNVLSGSWDNTIRTWDVETATNTTIHPGPTAVHSLAYNPMEGYIASGHADRQIRLWDPRHPEASLVWKSLSSHKSLVSSLAWHPSNPNLLLSGGYDNTTKLWDIRSELPLHTLTFSEKVLTVGWREKGQVIVSGGADCQLHFHRLSAGLDQ